MKLVQVTPGTGNFYCGICLRDNALVMALRRLGQDATLVPMYLPMMIDEPNAAGETPMFFGGINVYLQQKSSVFRHTPAWLDRLFDAPGLLRWVAGYASMTQEKDLGEITLSMLRGEEGHQAKELDKLLTWLSSEEHRPEVVCLSNVLLVGLARAIKARLRVPVVCTLQGEDSFLDGLGDPYRQQAWETLSDRAADVDAFIPVSHYYGDVMKRRLDIASDKVRVVHNGIMLEGYAPANAAPSPPAIGYLARWSPQKGLHTLVEAFIQLRKRGRVGDVKLRVAGTTISADEPFVKQLRSRLAECGLTREVDFLPNITLAEKQAFLKTVSVLSVPATYGEAFGLYVLEALAAGVPVVQPRHASFPELIEATGGGILCEPDNPEALALAIESLLLDKDRARALGARGRQAVIDRFGVERMAREVARVCEDVASRSVPRWHWFGNATMAHEFKLQRRVEFAETDMAGIMHFANFFRYMEETEHAFFRSLGLSIHMKTGDGVVTWPRVHAECDYLKPLRFEDQVEVHLLVHERRPKAIAFRFIFRKLNAQPPEEVARGSLVAVCVSHDQVTGRMNAIAIPAAIAALIEPAPAESLA